LELRDVNLVTTLKQLGKASSSHCCPLEELVKAGVFLLRVSFEEDGESFAFRLTEAPSPAVTEMSLLSASFEEWRGTPYA
jgi:hypothetical protein